MGKTMPVLVMVAGITLTGPPRAGAQGSTPENFIDLNVGAQPQRRTLSTSTSFPLYLETATVAVDQRITNGPMWEIGAGHRFSPSFAVRVAFSSFSSTGTASGVASIPNPLFFDQPLQESVGAAGLERTERAVHFQAVWFIPVTDEIDIALSAGPSFIRVSQQFAGNGTVAPGTQTLTLGNDTETGTAKGINVGFDGAYMFTKRYGVGLFIRYAGGSVDLPSASGVKAGGFQTGLGARIRF
jgi:hypothetical protein